jgi:hypothetical protein
LRPSVLRSIRFVKAEASLAHRTRWVSLTKKVRQARFGAVCSSDCYIDLQNLLLILALQHMGPESSTSWILLIDLKMGQRRYDKLDVQKKQICFLDLLPGRWIDLIGCSIRTVCLTEEPVYDALSYVWGNPQDTVPITVDGKTFDATCILTAALRRLRSSRDTRTL